MLCTFCGVRECDAELEKIEAADLAGHPYPIAADIRAANLRRMVRMAGVRPG